MDSQSNQSSRVTPTPHNSGSRVAIRLFVLVIAFVIAAEIAPAEIPGIPWLQYQLTPIVRATGLWQGRWTLFAPDPVINNGWVSAEIYHRTPDGANDATPITWDSPYWSKFGNWEKFYRFRHVNYFNRLPFREQVTADDFADFLCKEMLSTEVAANPIIDNAPPLRRAGDPSTVIVTYAAPSDSPAQLGEHYELRLSHNNLSIIMPDDGTLPVRGDEVWMATSRNMTIRRYQP